MATPNTPDIPVRPVSKDGQPEGSPAKEETQTAANGDADEGSKDITTVDWVEPAKKKKSKKSKKPKSKRGKVSNYT